MSNNKDFKVKNGIQPTVYQEGVGTVVSSTEVYSLSIASYDGKSFSVASQEGAAGGVQFKSDGTKMYVCGQAADSTFQYSLSTPYDVSTASYDSVSFNHTAQVANANCYDLFFKTDGTQMYVMFGVNDTVYQYTLSTAWDLSTASYSSKSFSVASQESGEPGGLAFSNDGTKMYVVGEGQATVFQYTLSSAWDLSTASYASKSFSVASQDTKPSGIAFSTSGNKMFISGENTDNIYLFILSTPFDVTTASFSVSLDISAYVDRAWYVALANDGTKMYVGGIGTTGGVSNNTIHQYSTALTTASLDLSSGSVFDYTPTSNVQVTLTNPAASGTSSGATLLLTGSAAEGGVLASTEYTGNSYNYSSTATSVQGIKVDNSGHSLYILSLTGNIVYQFTLSSPYNISTASYASKSFDTSSQASSARSLEFSSDGTKMYIGDQGTAAIYQYTLSTAFDVSTASYASKSLSISSQDSQFREARFKSDGTSLYVYGDTNVRVYQYNLTTAWDISTASYASKFMSPSSQTGAVRSFDITEDATKLFVFSYSNTQGLFQYTLSTAGDVSTATYDSVNYKGYATEVVNNAQGFDLENDDVSLYINDGTATTIFQYNVATPATITYPSTLQWPSGTAPTAPAIGETDVLTFNTTDGGTTYKSVLAIDGAK